MDPIIAYIIWQIALSADHLHCGYPEHATTIDSQSFVHKKRLTTFVILSCCHL